jgi:hypothetical protein
MQYLKLQVSNDEKITIFEQSVWQRWLFEGRIKGSELAKVITLHDFGLGCMDSKAGSSIFYDMANGSYVIWVGVSSHNKADLEIQLTYVAQDSGRIPCWVNDHAIPSLLRRNEVAVCSKGHYLQGPIDHFCHWESPYSQIAIFQRCRWDTVSHI